MIDHVERDLFGGSVVILVFEAVMHEVVRRHEQLRVTTVKQTVVYLLAHNLFKMSLLIRLEKLLIRVLWTIFITTTSTINKTSLVAFVFFLLFVLVTNDDVSLLVELNGGLFHRPKLIWSLLRALSLRD